MPSHTIHLTCGILRLHKQSSHQNWTFFHWPLYLEIRQLMACKEKHAVARSSTRQSLTQCWTRKRRWPALRTALFLIYGIVERWCHPSKQRQSSWPIPKDSVTPPHPPFPYHFCLFILDQVEKSCFTSESSLALSHLEQPATVNVHSEPLS